MIALLPESQVGPDTLGDEYVVYEARLGRTVLALVFLVIGLGGCLAPVVGAIGWIVTGLIGLPCVLISLVFLRGAARGWKNKWWIVRVRRDTVLLRLRSFLNSDLPVTDAVVARVPRAEIASVRDVRERRLVPGTASGESELHSLRALDFVLKSEETETLERAVAAERTPGRRDRGHFGAYPVIVPQPGVIRVVFSSHTMRLTPSLRRAVEALRAFSYPVDAERVDTRADWRKLSEVETDTLVDKCVAEGAEMEAIRLLGATRRMDLASAKREVERRRARGARNEWQRLSGDEIDALVDSHMASGREMEAIRVLRAARHMDLVSAKREVDRRRAKDTA